MGIERSPPQFCIFHFCSPALTIALAMPPLFLTTILDWLLVALLSYVLLWVVVRERRTLWMIRGLLLVVILSVISEHLGLVIITSVLEKLILGSVVALSVIFQSSVRRFLEKIGRGELLSLFENYAPYVNAKSRDVIDEVVEAVKELSKKRVGALIILEATGPVDEKDFSSMGVQIDAEISSKLLRTIFHKDTPLHDGAVFIRGSRIVSASNLFPVSQQHQSSQRRGARHQAAVSMSEISEDCICVVVSEETGSIALAEKGNLNRPLTSAELRKLLEKKLGSAPEPETVAPKLSLWSRQFKPWKRR